MKYQKFHLNRIKYLILILLSITFISNVKAIVKPTNNFYINDYANILSSETEEYILNKSVALNNVDGTQIVVVTVPNLEGMSLESYATQLFRNFGIGDSKKNNGLLLLLALEERQFRVEVGYGLEGILPDGKTGRFQDQYIIPYLKNNNWDEGVKNGYDAFYKEIVTLNNLNVDYNEPNKVGKTAIDDSIFKILFIASSIIGIVMGGIIRNLKNNKVLFVLLYIAICVGILIFLRNIGSVYTVFLIINLFFFLCGLFKSSSGGFYGRRGSSGGGGSSRGF